MKSDILTNLKKFKTKSIYFKYFNLILGVVLSLFVLYTILFISYYNYSLNKEIKSFANQHFSENCKTMEMIFDEADRLYSIALTNYYVSQFLNKELDMYSYQTARDIINPINGTLFTYVNNSNYVPNILVCNFKNNYVLSNISGGKLSDFKDTYWYKHYTETNERYFILPVYNELTQRYYISIGIAVNNDGLIVMQLDLNNFDYSLLQSDNTIEKNFYAVNNNNTVLYSKNRSDISMKITNFIDLNTLDLQIGNIVQKNTNDYIITAVKTDNGLTYISQISKKNFLERNTDLGVFIAISSAVIFIVLIFLCFAITHKIYSSIAVIISLFQTTKYNTSPCFDETLFITNNILNMIDRNKKIEYEITEKLENLRRYQNIALQTQINPHFLFNTLQMINLFISKTIKGDNDATKAIKLLSELLRITLDTKQSIIPLSLELTHAGKYMEIQNLKYKNRFNTVWNIDERVKSHLIVKLTLQPLLENCISHAFDKHKGILNICISAVIKNGSLIITVSDDGKGISDETLAEINKQLHNELIAENLHIGLSNVNQRIRLTFGDAYGLNISSSIGIGTTVTLNFPIEII